MMKTSIKILAVAGLFSAFTLSAPALAAPNDARRTLPLESRIIPLPGYGTVEAKPEFMRVVISVSTQDETVDKASTANRDAAEKVIAKIRALSVPQADIVVKGQDIRQGYSSRKATFSSISSAAFNAETSIEITLRDLTGASRILGAMYGFDDMRIVSMAWTVSDPQSFQDKARVAAIADARRRAELYVTAAGAKLGTIQIIEETGRGSGDNDFIQTKESNSSLSPPATVTFRSSVHTIWAIE